MSGLLAGKAVIITGAASGIGKACAQIFVREGAKILAVDFSGAQNALAAELGAAAIPFHADVSQEDQIEAMFAEGVAAFGRIDGVLNVAGTQAGRQLGAEATVEEYERMTATNLRGTLLCCKHAVRAMTK